MRNKLIEWIGLFIALLSMILISKKNVGIAMFIGAVLLGVLSNPGRLAYNIWETITDPSMILLAAVVGIIPIIGSTLSISGQMDSLVNNMRIGKKKFLLISPALVGMLPMPGGALLSAPIVDKAGKDVENASKAGLNVWFRHLLYLVYPLTPGLIVSAEAVNLDIYMIIPYLILPLLLCLILGYLFFLRRIPGRINYQKKFSWKELFFPLLSISIAPILDFGIKAVFSPPIKELATLVAVLASLFVATFSGKLKTKSLMKVVINAKPWNFILMIIGIAFFLRVFSSSGIINLIVSMNVSLIDMALIGFLLGFGTGRIMTPAGIVFPILVAKSGILSLPAFSAIYFSIFLGYILTPVHPCVSLTVEFFKINMKDYLRKLLPPVIISLLFILAFLEIYA